MKESVLRILSALVCAGFLSGCVESRMTESVDLADASVYSNKGKTAQNGKRIDDLESRLERLEKLVGKSDYDYPSLRHDVRKDLEERLKKLEKVVGESDRHYPSLRYDVRELKEKAIQRRW